MILSAMMTHSSNFFVQEVCCGTIFVLSYNNDKNRVMIADAGGIAMILIAMKTHLSKAEVQEAGCRALFFLPYNNDNNKVTIAEAGGITTILMKTHSSNVDVQHYAGSITMILSAMKTHLTNADVLLYGCAALWILAEYEDKKKNEE